MILTEVANKITSERTALLIRPRVGPLVSLAPREYDVKPLFTGSKRGWVVLDLFTASAVAAVGEGLNEANRAKFNSMPLPKAINITWKLVKGGRS